MVEALWEELRRRDRWLLVFGNAEQPEQLQPFCRRRPWPCLGDLAVGGLGEWARPLRLGCCPARKPSFLCTRTGTQDEQAAGMLAEALGDLPLATAEAAAYIEETQVSLNEYLQLVRERTVELFGFDKQAGTERRVATVWSLSLERVREGSGGRGTPAAVRIYLAPDDIPCALPRGRRPAAR